MSSKLASLVIALLFALPFARAEDSPPSAEIGSSAMTASGKNPSSRDLSVGLFWKGHLLFQDVVAPEVHWEFLNRGKTFFNSLRLESGLGMSTDAQFFEIPLLARAEMVRVWHFGFELAGGINGSLNRGAVALTPVLCAGAPISYERIRIQTEYCLNVSAFTFVGFGFGATYAL